MSESAPSRQCVLETAAGPLSTLSTEQDAAVRLALRAAYDAGVARAAQPRVDAPAADDESSGRREAVEASADQELSLGEMVSEIQRQLHERTLSESRAAPTLPPGREEGSPADDFDAADLDDDLEEHHMRQAYNLPPGAPFPPGVMTSREARRTAPPPAPAQGLLTELEQSVLTDLEKRLLTDHRQGRETDPAVLAAALEEERARVLRGMEVDAADWRAVYRAAACVEAAQARVRGIANGTAYPLED
mmetsp:Transcript_1062/g.2924  ORF Transcript_1062/g.2924 Transcript_1062/m.2924 type:complete len:247 (+) Transcript_1062:92-832(+)